MISIWMLYANALYMQYLLLLWWSVDVDDDDPSSLCTVMYPHVTAQSEVGGTVTVADRAGDTQCPVEDGH